MCLFDIYCQPRPARRHFSSPHLKGLKLKKVLLNVLSATALLAGSAPVFAGTIKGASVEITYSNLFIPVSVTGNTFTFTTNSYIGGYGYVWGYNNDYIQASAYTGQTFTGDVQVSTEVQYDMGNYYGYNGAYSARQSTDLSVFAIPCYMCSIYDGPKIGQGATSAGAIGSNPTSGTAYGSTSVDSIGGGYNYLGLMVTNYYDLPSGGMLHLNRFTVSFDTVGPSAVPELPPAVMMGAGVMVLGLYERLRRRKLSGTAQA